jgi:hypothetical protein
MLKSTVTAFLLCAAHAFAQTPTVDTAKQALNKRWQQLKPDGMTERNVLFQEITAGRASAGNYPFQVTVVIRDYGPGYPANRFYGTTCVSRIEHGTYTLSPDDAGGWHAEGRMTPDLSEKKCQNNPSAGVSAIPLATLSGTAAPAGLPAPSAQPAPAATGNAAGTVAPGAYECWSSNRANLTLNFTVTGASKYTGYNGSAGSFTYDAASTRITFKGGSLDGVMPTGFYAIYYAPGGRPTVSFRSASGSEAAFCQKK